MRITLSGRANTAYILFTEYTDGDVARSKFLADDDINGEFTFDFDQGGRLLGIEVKFASAAFPPGVLEDADPV